MEVGGEGMTYSSPHRNCPAADQACCERKALEGGRSLHAALLAPRKPSLILAIVTAASSACQIDGARATKLAPRRARSAASSGVSTFQATQGTTKISDHQAIRAARSSSSRSKAATVGPNAT